MDKPSSIVNGGGIKILLQLTKVYNPNSLSLAPTLFMTSISAVFAFNGVIN